MRRHGHAQGGRAATAVLALVICLAAACATIEPPGGGPVDVTPPELIIVSPDSGATGLVDVKRIELVFSEKVEPRQALRFVNFYPPLEVHKTKWKGRRRAIIEFLDPLPADTVVVIEIPAGFTDVHRVKSTRTWRYPIATADSLPAGAVSGRLLFEDEPAPNGVVELYAVPPETLEYFRQDPLRKAETDSLGRFTLPWLAVPGGPYLLRGFIDKNTDLKPAESEPQRLLPVEFELTIAAPVFDAGDHVLYDQRTPGRLLALFESGEHWSGDVFGWTLKIAEDDTGFVPVHQRQAPQDLIALQPGDTAVFDPAGPGLVRAIVFVDLDGDSLLSALPDSAAAPDTILWTWEPYAIADSLEVEPGLPGTFDLPAFADTVVSCLVAPPSALVLPDSVAAPADSIPEPSGETP